MSQTKTSLGWVLGISFVAGLLVSLFFAKKKGSVLRTQLKKVHATEGNLASIILLKDEYVALLDEIHTSIDDVWHTKEMQSALGRLGELTKELLPRIEG